jgi:hypothetical protein
MANCAYARGVKLYKSHIFNQQSNRNFSIILFEIRRYYLFIHTTRKFNDKIMKIAQVLLFKNKRLSMNLLVIKR